MTTSTTPAYRAGVRETIAQAPPAARVILLGVLLNRLSGFLTIFLVLFLTARGYTASQTALAVGTYGAGSVVSYLIGGVLAARLGARNVTVACMAGSASLTAALLYLPTFPLLLVAVALAGVMSQAYWPASVTLLSDLTAAHRQVMIQAMYRFAVNVGSAAAPLVGLGLLSLGHQRYTLVLWCQAAVALAYGALAAATLPPGRRPTGAPDAAAGAEGDGPGTAGGEDADADVAGSAVRGYRAVLSDRRFVLFLVAAFFYTAVYMQYLSTLPLDVKRSGLPVLWYTVAVSLNGLVVIALELPLTTVSQRLSAQVTVPIAFALVGAGMAVYGLPLVPVVIVAGTLLWTAGEMIGAPRVFSYPAVAAPPRLKSYYFGAFQFVFGLASAAGQTVGVLLFGVLGHGVWPVVALGSLVSVTCAWLALRPSASPAAPPSSSAPPSSAPSSSRAQACPTPAGE